MDPTELQKTLSELAAEKERIEALTKAYELVAKHEQLKKNKSGDEHNENTTRGVTLEKSPQDTAVSNTRIPSKAARVRNAVSKITYDRFSLDDVMAHDDVEGMLRKEVSFVLSAMKRKGKIFVIEQGVGSASSTYSKVKPISETTDGLQL